MSEWGPLAVLAGLALGAVLGKIIPSMSRRRNVKRARTAGAIWTGLANFDAKDPGTALFVRTAFAQVGALYGLLKLPKPMQERPVGGLLFIERDRLRWVPRIWLGRGRPNAWEVSVREIKSVEIKKSPAPTVGSYEARLVTEQGEARFLIVDPDGLKEAIDSIVSTSKGMT